MKELAKVYSPDNEQELYKNWLEKGYFKPKEQKGKQPFTIVIPPPNVTGQLHMGHAFDETLQDVLVRYHRMQGIPTLWVPGTDHAGIATQIKVEETLRKDGISRYDLGREKFVEKVWEWKRKFGDIITNQLKRMGSSCDWSREAFTMDENLSAAVKKVFCRLYDKGQIYRGFRIINYCPHCETALSDAEVEHKDTDGAFWHIRYYFKDSDEYIVVATTRPETMLGDTAVAVNPNDERYRKNIGRTLVLPLVEREIPLIADEHADPAFGTGAVKITPAHDPNDFEVGQRAGLPLINVFDKTAHINGNGGKYEGLDRFEAREKICADLEAGGYLVKKEACVHSVGHCCRCSTMVEPTASRQWFVRMDELKKAAIKAVEDGDIVFIPERFSKNYLNWMYNLHDWCISRQLWWGHRIPAYYCDECGETVVAETAPGKCPKCGGKMTQESDVLDTWFSSALWPFSTLGWPNDLADYDKFYPTSTLVTGYDIITFWVSRMITMGEELTGKAPFSKVLIHGLVRDAQGRKMSKSLGNGINPLEIIDKYGTDALRFALLTGNSPGNDMRFSDEKAVASRNFSNKLWNCSRFVMMNLKSDDVNDYVLPSADKLPIEDKWILSSYNTLVREVRANLDSYELGVALAKLYDFIWSVFCDWYIEIVKPRLFDGEDKTAQAVLLHVLTGTLKLLHPFMPYITETIYQALPHSDESIMISEYPVYDKTLDFTVEEEKMDHIISATRAIRNRRAEMNVPPSKKASLYIVTTDKSVFSEDIAFIFKKLACAENVYFVDGYADENAVMIAETKAKLYIPLSDIVDTDAEKKRLSAERENLLACIARCSAKLSNAEFTSRAPAAVVDGEKKRLAGYEEKLSAVEELIKKYE
ncbi:MAG: valine--tRNA ligase [Clostridia bacterium]|nr:valine--tRNA ligase [Clostridia bacterium]